MTRPARLFASSTPPNAHGKYVVIREPHRPDWSQLRFTDGEPIDFITHLRQVLPEEAVGWVGKAVVMNRHAFPVTSRREFIVDAATIARRASGRLYSRPQRLLRPVRLRGTTLNIACSSTVDNYAHAVFDGLGRLAVAVEAGVDLDAVDHVIVPAFPSKNIATLLDLAGVPAEKRRPATKGAHFRVDNLIQPTAPGRTPYYSPTGPDFMRTLGVEPTPGGPRRLLMMREGERRRAIVNPEGLAALAADYHLENYDPIRADFSPSDFAATELIVAAHGASMGDIGFCPPGTRLVEIMPSAHHEPHFATFAASAGFRYVAVHARTVDGEWDGDFEVDYDAIREGIDQILSRE